MQSSGQTSWKTFTSSISSTSASSVWSTCIRPICCIEIWNQQICFWIQSAIWKLQTLVSQDLLIPKTPTNNRFLLTTLQQGGIEPQRSFWDLTNTQRAPTCGAWAASWQSSFLESQFFLVLQLWTNLIGSWRSQVDPVRKMLSQLTVPLRKRCWRACLQPNQRSSVICSPLLQTTH